MINEHQTIIPIRFTGLSATQEKALVDVLSRLNEQTRNLGEILSQDTCKSIGLSEAIINDLQDKKSLFSKYVFYLLLCIKYNIDKAELEREYYLQKLRFFNGNLDLTSDDYESLKSKLHSNNGSRDHIKGLRRWIIERSHSINAIGATIRDFIVHLPGHISFDKIIHTLYVINDIFYNAKVVSLIGPYTTILTDPTTVETKTEINIQDALFPYLRTMLEKAYDVAKENAEQKEKIIRLINLWESKGFYEPDRTRTLILALNQRSQLTDENLSYSTYQVPLISPTIDDSMIQQFSKPKSIPNSASNNVNVAAVKIPALPLVTFDATKVSVGSMINMVRAAQKAGYPPYIPFELANISSYMSTSYDMKRVESKVNEFYQKLADLLRRDLARSNLPKASENAAYSRSSDNNYVDNYSNRGRSNWNNLDRNYAEKRPRSNSYSDTYPADGNSRKFSKY